MTREEAAKEIHKRHCTENRFCHDDCMYSENACPYGMAIAALQEPERKRGRWIKLCEPDENDNIKCRCSECHAEDVHSKSAIVPFCWKCGANMRGEQE